MSADFEVCAVALGAYLTAWQQLAHKTFADDDWLESVADRHFTKIELHAFFTPRHRKIAAHGSERDFGGYFLKTLFVQLDSI